MNRYFQGFSFFHILRYEHKWLAIESVKRSDTFAHVQKSIFFAIAYIKISLFKNFIKEIPGKITKEVVSKTLEKI